MLPEIVSPSYYSCISSTYNVLEWDAAFVWFDELVQIRLINNKCIDGNEASHHSGFQKVRTQHLCSKNCSWRADCIAIPDERRVLYVAGYFA